MLLLGIETSCDETAVAVVADGRRILSNVISSQVEVHARYGGVVPEVASRQHMLAMTPIYHQALREAGISTDDLDGVSVTAGPGLAGSLLVGVNYAKGLAMGLGLPLYGMNHLEGHMYAAWLEEGPTPEDAVGFPLVCLLVSGGHTDLVLMRGHGDYHHLGGTRDDAAGEAFDKAARVMGLGFPGGPAIQREAQGASRVEPLPRAWMRGTLEFSFSGLKTALLHRARELGVAWACPTGRKSWTTTASNGAGRWRQASRRRRWTCSSGRRWTRRGSARRGASSWAAASPPTRRCARRCARVRPCRSSSLDRRCAPTTGR